MSHTEAWEALRPKENPARDTASAKYRSAQCDASGTEGGQPRQPRVSRGYSYSYCTLPTHRLACLIETPVYAVPMVLVGARADGLAEVVNGTAPLGPEVAATVGFGLAMLLIFFAVMRRITQAGRRRVEAADATRPFEEEPPAGAACSESRA